MNYKLIFQLSLFGLAMSVATVFWVPSNIEPVLWLLIFIICAYFIAFKCAKKYFLNGFMVSIFNCVWIIAGHIVFYQTYLANHPQEAEMMTKIPILHHSPRLMMLMAGSVIGIASGLILGLFAFIGSKIIQKK
jgi:hypothetical protein